MSANFKSEYNKIQETFSGNSHLLFLPLHTGTLECSPNPCENNGKCQYVGGEEGFMCICNDTYVGHRCEHQCEYYINYLMIPWHFMLMLLRLYNIQWGMEVAC